ncbi:adenosylmethionine decarboxylase [Pasteuria penetrans]|uniref:adenosylmethionine decarboxylase n=1 Tax=Pasteuria penetrans TaxID=86005 RepID=UPI000FB1DB37|nr:adenosylmethionine decarboxylase [Pasteuria penetrans]
MGYSTFGTHVALDAWGADCDLLNDVERLEVHLREAASACGATVLSAQAKRFQPQGATVLLMLSESHLSIHTYPESGFAALDCYTCGHAVDPMAAVGHMLGVLRPRQFFTKILRRGVGAIEVLTSKDVGVDQNQARLTV